MKLPFTGTPGKVVIEDPEALGYRLGEDPLLAVLEASGWQALEDAALRAAGDRG